MNRYPRYQAARALQRAANKLAYGGGVDLSDGAEADEVMSTLSDNPEFPAGEQSSNDNDAQRLAPMMQHEGQRQPKFAPALKDGNTGQIYVGFGGHLNVWEDIVPEEIKLSDAPLVSGWVDHGGKWHTREEAAAAIGDSGQLVSENLPADNRIDSDKIPYIAKLVMEAAAVEQPQVVDVRILGPEVNEGRGHSPNSYIKMLWYGHTIEAWETCLEDGPLEHYRVDGHEIEHMSDTDKELRALIPEAAHVNQELIRIIYRVWAENSRIWTWDSENDEQREARKHKWNWINNKWVWEDGTVIEPGYPDGFDPKSVEPMDDWHWDDHELTPRDPTTKISAKPPEQMHWNGLSIIIENPKGAVREGTDKGGYHWEIKMKDHYGFIQNTSGEDGEGVDVFINPDAPEHFDNQSGSVYIVHQEVDGEYDEDKVMIGYASKSEAEDAYRSNYEDGWDGLGDITEMTDVDFINEYIPDHWHAKPKYKKTAQAYALGPNQLNDMGVDVGTKHMWPRHVYELELNTYDANHATYHHLEKPVFLAFRCDPNDGDWEYLIVYGLKPHAEFHESHASYADPASAMSDARRDLATMLYPEDKPGIMPSGLSPTMVQAQIKYTDQFTQTEIAMLPQDIMGVPLGPVQPGHTSVTFSAPDVVIKIDHPTGPNTLWSGHITYGQNHGLGPVHTKTLLGMVVELEGQILKLQSWGHWPLPEQRVAQINSLNDLSNNVGESGAPMNSMGPHSTQDDAHLGEDNTSEDVDLHIQGMESIAQVEAPYSDGEGPLGTEFEEKDDERKVVHAMGKLGTGEDPYKTGRLYGYNDLLPQHQSDVKVNKALGKDRRAFYWLRTEMPLWQLIDESEYWYRKNQHQKWKQVDRNKTLKLAELMQTGATVTPLMVSPPGEENGGLWEGYHRLRAAELLMLDSVPVMMKIDPSDAVWQLRVADFKREPWVCVDFDGTLVDDEPHGDVHGEIDLSTAVPFDGAAETMKAMIDQGWRVTIFTARDPGMGSGTAWEKPLKAWLKKYNIQYSDIMNADADSDTGGKPPADVFIDNNAIQFDPKVGWGGMLDNVAAMIEQHREAGILGIDDNLADAYTNGDETRSDLSEDRGDSVEGLIDHQARKK
jgi:hypothetical protein